MVVRSKRASKGLLIGYKIGRDGEPTDVPVYIDLATVDRHCIKLGKSGSGKSVSTCDEFFALSKYRSVALLDPHSMLALDALDRVIRNPRLAKRTLFITIKNPEFVSLIDYMQQSYSETKGNRSRRIYLASLFTKAIIATAGTSSLMAGASFVRLKTNCSMGVRLLLELQLPMAFLPHLFRFKSPILESLIDRCQDADVRAHFNNLRAQGSANQLFTLTESTIMRLNLLFNSPIMEAMFSVAGSGLTVDEILRRERMILIGDFGITGDLNQEHSRMAIKLFYEALTNAAMSRTFEDADANPLSLYIDEASSSGILDLGFAQSLQNLRKFRLHVCAIAQGCATIDALQPTIRLTDSLFENISSKFVYGMASDVDAQRMARLGIAGMDFKEVKHRKEIERQRLIGYEESTRTTVSTNHEGKKSFSVTPIERPMLETELDEQLLFYTPEEIFNRKAGELIGTQIGRFTYYGPAYPGGIQLYTPKPPRVSEVTKRLRKRKRQEFIQKQLRSFPYRDIDGVRREFEQLLAKYGMPSSASKKEAMPESESPFE